MYFISNLFFILYINICVFPGILGLSSQALFYVTVESLGMTLKVNVTDDGSFTVSSDWILNVAGKYEISKFTREHFMFLLMIFSSVNYSRKGPSVSNPVCSICIFCLLFSF